MLPWRSALFCAALFQLHAQSTTAELSGTVRDPAGLAVAGAVLEASRTGAGVAAGVAASVTSRTDGSYRFLALPPGRYSVTAAKEGFAVLRRDGILLAAGGKFISDLELHVGDVSQSIEVTAATPMLQASRGTASFVVDDKKVAALPLDGRNFIPLLALSPGVSLPPGSLLPRINGSRPRVSEYIYDGVSVLQPEPGQVAFYPIVDAIEEVRIETNSPPAEYGRSNGGVILVNLKSGSNQFHGALFEFLRNESMNARNLFAAAGPKPDYRRNQYGFVAGGPVQKNEMFFFTAWQGTRLDTGVVRTSTVPTGAQKLGAFPQPLFDPSTTRQTPSGYVRDPFPDNTIPAGRIDAAARAVVNRYPAPNSAAGANGAPVNNYLRVGADVTAQDQFDFRLDSRFGPRHKAFARYSFSRDDSNPATPLPDGSGTFAGALPGETRTRTANIASEHTWNLTPASVNQFRFGFTRRGLRRSALATGRPATEVSQIPNIPLSSFPDVLPTYDVVGFQQLGPPANANARFATSVTQFLDTYSRSSGRHSWKAGADIRLERLNVLQPPSPAGNFQFTNIFTANLSPAGAPVPDTGSSFASFLLGQVTRFQIDPQTHTLEPRAAIAEFFLQEDWQAARRLSLNLGVRYTLNAPSTVENDQGAVFNLRTQTLDYLGRNGNPRTARSLEKRNLGPRAGFAFRLTETFVMRAGYSLTWIEQAGITTPFTTPFFPFVQTLGQQTLDNITPAFVLAQGPSVTPRFPGPDAGLGQSVFGVQRDNGSGYAQQWNVSLQKTFGADWSFETGYLGSKLTRLGAPDVNLNQLTVDQLRLGPQLLEQIANPFLGQLPSGSSLAAATLPRAQLLRPYPRFATVALYRNNIGHSTYHSLQARVERRLAGGLTFSAAYTFSRLIDDAGAVFDSAVLTGPVANFQAADSFNKRLEKDVSTGNIPHVFSSGFVYDLPLGRGRTRILPAWAERFAGGWQVAGIVRMQSGSPIAVTQATNLNAFAGFGTQRPNRVSEPRLPSTQRATSKYFDTAAFAHAPQFTIGNSSRNPVSGPGYRTIDLMAGRTFELSERLRAEFRAEAFNVTNTPPLGNPNGSFGAAAFGSITTALDPRVFELVVKLRF